MERELTLTFEGPATEQVHIPVRSLLAIVDVLEGAIRKRCGRLHTLKTMCELEIVSFDAPSSTAQLRLQGPEDCERAWRSEDPLQRVMTELERTAGDTPHPPGRLRCQIASELADGIRSVEFAAPACGSPQWIARDERKSRPFSLLRPEEKMPNFDAEAFNDLVERMR